MKTRSIAILSLPVNQIEKLSALDFVERVEIAMRTKPLLDSAIPSSNVSKVHQGIDLKQTYTGKGVIVGIGDFGVDFTHPMFSTPDGTPRVKVA